MQATSRGWRAPFLALAALLAILAVTYARGEDSYVRIDDHLDGQVPLYRLLSTTQPLVGSLDDSIPAVFGGIPRNSMPTTFHIGPLLYYAFPPFWAHVANELLVRLVAFAGIYLLLRRKLLRDAPPFIPAGAALAFALQPFMLIAYGSVAGAPLLLYALLNLQQRRGSAFDWGVVAVYPFYSGLAYVGFFILLLLGLFVLFELAARRRLDVPLVLAGGLIALGYSASEYRLLYQTFLDPDYVSYRAEFARFHGGLLHVARAIVRSFLRNHMHAGGLQSPFILGSMALALALGLIQRLRTGAGVHPADLRSLLRAGMAGRSALGALLGLGLLCLALSLYVGVWQWGPVQRLVEAAPGPVRSFNFHRLQWFASPLFALGFACALCVLDRRGRWGRGVAVALLGTQLGWVIWNGDAWTEARRSGLTFRGYYSPKLFDEIRAHIGRRREDRVVSLGLTPAIALYNGFHVLDGIVQDYPVTHKHRFRRIIAAELARDPDLRTWYDGWGGHVDLMSSELGRTSGYARRIYTKDVPGRVVEDLAIDVDALGALGAGYVISAVEIRNAAALSLSLEGRFEREDSPWEISLYALPTAAEGR